MGTLNMEEMNQNFYQTANGHMVPQHKLTDEGRLQGDERRGPVHVLKKWTVISVNKNEDVAKFDAKFPS